MEFISHACLLQVVDAANWNYLLLFAGALGELCLPTESGLAGTTYNGIAHHTESVRGMGIHP